MGGGLAGSDLVMGCLLVFLAHATPYYLAARLMDELVPDGASRAMPRTVTLFLLILSVAALLAAIGGSLALVQSGLMRWDEFKIGLLPWMIGDFAGALVLGAPLVSMLARVNNRLDLDAPRLTPPGGHSLFEFGIGPFLLKLSLCLVMVLGSSILTSLLPNYEPIAFLLFFVIIPQMWIVHTESAFRSLVSIAVLSTTIAVCTRLFDVSHYALINQFAMIIIASSAYFGMSVPVLYAHNKALQQMLRRDTLTEAASRLHFIEQSRSELSRAKRYREPVSLIVIDIDHFKQINDQLGHALGDRVLREVASVCLDTLRSSDVLGRLGGDEFAVLLPVTALDTAEDVAQRLCRALGEIDLVDGGRVVDISASLGVIEVKLDEETYEQALERADGALYEAKRAGRNRVQAG